MTTFYQTNFSDTSNLPKKDIKEIESKFPFIPPEEVKYEPCGKLFPNQILVQILNFTQFVIIL